MAIRPDFHSGVPACMRERISRQPQIVQTSARLPGATSGGAADHGQSSTCFLIADFRQPSVNFTVPFSKLRKESLMREPEVLESLDGEFQST
jgi:hypothetical protein